MSTMTGTTLAAEARLRERLAATFAAWRLLDDEIEAVLEGDDALLTRGRELARHRQRMADEMDLLQREWVFRSSGGLR